MRRSNIVVGALVAVAVVSLKATQPVVQLRDQLGLGDRFRTQAFVIDYRQRLGAWDTGVIPYEIAEGFTAAQRDRILASLERWTQVAPIVFVPRTTQSAYLTITRDTATATQPSACFSAVGQARRGIVVRTGTTISRSTFRTCRKMRSAISISSRESR